MDEFVSKLTTLHLVSNKDIELQKKALYVLSCIEFREEWGFQFLVDNPPLLEYMVQAVEWPDIHLSDLQKELIRYGLQTLLIQEYEKLENKEY